MVQEYTKRNNDDASVYTTPGPKYMLPSLMGDKDHDPRSIYNKNPAYSFGIRHGKFKGNNNPGPIYCPNPKILRDGLHESQHFSLSGRLRDQKNVNTPGPGAPISQKALSATCPTDPSFSFGGRHRYYTVNTVPAANCYKLGEIDVQSSKCQAPSYSLKGLLKVDKVAVRTPGPGNYTTIDSNIYKNRGPLFTLTGRYSSHKDCSRYPGPGTYKVNKASIQHCSPSYSFGVRHSDHITPLIVEDISCS